MSKTLALRETNGLAEGYNVIRGRFGARNVVSLLEGLPSIHEAHTHTRIHKAYTQTRGVHTHTHTPKKQIPYLCPGQPDSSPCIEGNQ